MSMYNMMNGVSPATFMLLPMLGRHPDAYPRFRDCFSAVEGRPEYDGHIMVFTRTGGGNREGYATENAQLEEHPGFVETFDWEDDSTYAVFVFEVPEEWKEAYNLIGHGGPPAAPVVYQKQVRKVYPKLNEKWDELWPETKE